MSTPILPDYAKAGDIITFTGTYNSAGAVSHIGIYVGDGTMLPKNNEERKEHKTYENK